jgi:16S rRNA (adenine1518-N6/adenine1519-N6)-dimethyltransferase
MKHNDYVNNQVNQNDFFIKKKYSQNFLLDENIIKKIVDAGDIDKQTSVIEIGPGFGALTKYIIKQAHHVLLYEIDQELIPHLNVLFKDDDIHILNQDFLKVHDIDQDIKTYLGDDRIVVMSNLPYHITTPIIMKILEESHKIDRLILMMQLEVAKRLTSKPNTKDYNALSIIIQDQTDARYLFKVPKTVFKPKPKVDSAVICLDIKNNQTRDPQYYEFLHRCFQQRRKTLTNNLNTAYQIDKSVIQTILKDMNLHENIRAEALDTIQLKKIYSILKKEDYV